VARLIQAVTEAGVEADPVSIVNVYVSLKSKPLAILVGPAQARRSLMAGRSPTGAFPHI
jgi:hypothetical protein